MNLRHDALNHPLFTSKQEETIKERFFDLVCLMARLRGSNGCPWDIKQTPSSLRKYILEETYEVLEALDSHNWDSLEEELGDFLFQVIFQAQIQSESGRFDIGDVLNAILEKMIRRHPHVFGGLENLSVEVIRQNWGKIKKEEKQTGPQIFDGFSFELPGLLASYKIGKKASEIGFDWDSPKAVLEKVYEEIGELIQAIDHNDPKELQEELGDLLFSVSNLTRKLGFEPEETLRSANRKFVSRFNRMETLARKKKMDLKGMSMSEMDSLWDLVKQEK